MKVVHSELTFRTSNYQFDIIDFTTRETVEQLIHKKYAIQSKKLNTIKKPKIPLHNNVNYSEHVFCNTFINLRDCKFNNSEITLLEKGFNHNIKPTINVK